MGTPSSPFRWPDSWKDKSLMELVTGAGLTLLPQGALPLKGRWPGIRGMRRTARGVRAEAGPTGAPWVDSNGWLIRLEAALNPGQPLWVDATPPEGATEKEYLLAICDAAAYGGRWVVTLDPSFAASLARKQPDALRIWKRMAEAVRFFDRHADWASREPQGVLGVVADFQGPSRFLSREVLNLTARQHQPYRILDRAQAATASFAGLKAVVYPDSTPPPGDVRAALTRFAESGGLLISSAKWGPPPADSSPDPHPRYAVGPLGKGRLAVARAAMADPYLVANDALMLLGHREDPIRFYNAGTMGSYYTRGLVQVIHYASRPEKYPASFHVQGKFGSARLWTLGEDKSRPLEVRPDRGGVEVHLPEFAVYAAVALE